MESDSLAFGIRQNNQHHWARVDKGPHTAKVNVTAKGLAFVNITYAQFETMKGLDLYEVVNGKEEIIDSSRFFHLA